MLKVKIKHLWNETFGGWQEKEQQKHEPDNFIDTLKHFSWQMEMDIGNWQISVRFLFSYQFRHSTIKNFFFLHLLKVLLMFIKM